MVSVIVPNYNHLKFLPQRLDTIINQTFQDFEVILLDDCSTDGSWEYLKTFESHPKVSHCIRNDANSGSPFRQWKKGLDLAQFQWIWIAESDDYSDLNFLKNIISSLGDHVTISFSNSIDVDELGEPYTNSNKIFSDCGFKLLETSFLMNGKIFIHHYLRYKNILNNASSVVFRKPNTFPEEVLDMKYSGDWFFWIYLLKNGGGIRYLHDKLNYFRYHNSTTRVFVDNYNELKKKDERFSCISFSQRVLNFKNLFDINYSEYNDDVENYFHIIRKFGRLKRQALFPKIPFFLYRKYYSFFINSLLPKKN